MVCIFPMYLSHSVFFRSLPASDGDSTGSLTKPLNLVILGSEGLASDFITETRVSIYKFRSSEVFLNCAWSHNRQGDIERIAHTSVIFFYSTVNLHARLTKYCSKLAPGAKWLSGRVLDSRPRVRGFKPHRRHCVVSLSKTH